MIELTDIFDTVEEVGKKGGTGKRTGWKGVLAISQPSLLGLGEDTGLALNFNLKAAKCDTDQQELSIKTIDRRNGQELINKEVVITETGQINLKEHVERRSFTVDKFDSDSIRKGKNSFLEELVLSGTVEDVPAEHIANMQDGQEVGKFQRVTEITVEGAVHISRLGEYKFHEFYMLKPNTDEHEKPSRVFELANKMIEKQLALVGFFSWGRGFKYYTGVIYPFKRKDDDQLWLIMGLAEGRTLYDNAWSLSGKDSTSTKAVPVVNKPKVQISK